MKKHTALLLLSDLDPSSFFSTCEKNELGPPEIDLDDFYKQHPSLTRKAEADKDWKDWYREEFALHEGEKRLKDSLESFYTDKAGQQATFAENLTVADYDEFMHFPDKVTAASVPGSSSGAFWLALQCLLAGVWAWWSGRKRSLTHPA